MADSGMPQIDVHGKMKTQQSAPSPQVPPGEAPSSFTQSLKETPPVPGGLPYAHPNSLPASFPHTSKISCSSEFVEF